MSTDPKTTGTALPEEPVPNASAIDSRRDQEQEASKPTAEAKLAREIEKLEVEIEGLRIKNRNEKSIGRFASATAPLVGAITMLLGIVAFVWGTYTYYNDKAIDREQKRRDEARADQDQFQVALNQLLDLTNRDTESFDKPVAVRLTGVLAELEQLNRRIPPDIAPDFQSREKLVTLVLAEFVKSEACDFDLERDVEFDAIARFHWPAFGRAVAEDRPYHATIMWKYLNAIERRFKTTSPHLETLRYDVTTNSWTWDVDEPELRKGQVRARSLLALFRDHMKLCPEAERASWVDRFERVTGASQLKTGLFADLVPPSQLRPTKP